MKKAPLSDQATTSSTASEPAFSDPCASCGAPLASDQRYCLECGARRAYLSSVLLDGLQPTSSLAGGERPPAMAAEVALTDPVARPNNTMAVIAGVGVLLLAMGVGVLIGRSSSGAGKVTTAPPQVISVASAGETATSPTATSPSSSFSGDWPAGKSGYTVQLQTLSEAGTQVNTVDGAKSAAADKGAQQVGALKSAEFSSLTAGDYIIYSGVYTKKDEAQQALAGLKKSFPSATVIRVSNESGSPSSESGVGQTPSKPAPPSVLKDLHKGGSGQSYEQKSKNLPNVVSTG